MRGTGDCLLLPFLLLTLPVVYQTCAGNSNRRQWSPVFPFASWHNMDGSRGKWSDGVTDTEVNYDARKTVDTFSQVLTDWHTGFLHKNHRHFKGRKERGVRTMPIQHTARQTWTPSSQSLQDMQRLKRDLEDIINYDTSCLRDGINKLLLLQRQQLVDVIRQTGAVHDGQCSLSVQVRQMFLGFGQPPDIQQLVDTLHYFLHTLHTANSGLATKLQDSFLSAGGSAGGILQNFLQGRHILAIESVLKMAKTLSDEELRTLYVVSEDVKAGTESKSVVQALEDFQLVLSSLSSNREVISTTEVLVSLLRTLDTEEKSLQSLSVLSESLPLFTDCSLMSLALQNISSSVRPSQVFEAVLMLIVNTSDINTIQIIQLMPAVITAVLDSSDFLRSLTEIVRDANLSEAMRMLGQLFARSGAELNQLLQTLSTTISMLAAHADTVEAFLQLSPHKDVTEALESLSLLIADVSVRSPELYRLIPPTMAAVRQVLMNRELVEAIHTFSSSPNASRILDALGSVVRRYNLSGTYYTDINAIKKFLAFFTSDPALTEAVKYQSAEVEANVYSIGVRVLKALGLTGPDAVTSVSALSNMLAHLVQTPSVADSFLRLSRNPDLGNTIVFVMQLLGRHNSLIPTVSRAMLAVDGFSRFATDAPEFVQAVANFTDSASLTRSLSTLASWLAPDDNTGNLSIILHGQICALTVINDPDLKFSLQLFNESHLLLHAFQVFRVLYGKMTNVSPDRNQQAISDVVQMLMSLHNDSDAYEVFEMIVGSRVLLGAVTDMAGDSSLLTVFTLMAEKLTFRQALLQIAHSLSLKQAVPIFHDIISALTDSQYAGEALDLAVQAVTGSSAETQLQVTFGLIRQLIWEMQAETEVYPPIRNVQRALVDLLKLLDADGVISVSKSDTVFLPVLSTASLFSSTSSPSHSHDLSLTVKDTVQHSYTVTASDGLETSLWHSMSPGLSQSTIINFESTPALSLVSAGTGTVSVTSQVSTSLSPETRPEPKQTETPLEAVSVTTNIPVSLSALESPTFQSMATPLVDEVSRSSFVSVTSSSTTVSFQPSDSTSFVSDVSGSAGVMSSSAHLAVHTSSRVLMTEPPHEITPTDSSSSRITSAFPNGSAALSTSLSTGDAGIVPTSRAQAFGTSSSVTDMESTVSTSVPVFDYRTTPHVTVTPSVPSDMSLNFSLSEDTVTSNIKPTSTRLFITTTIHTQSSRTIEITPTTTTTVLGEPLTTSATPLSSSTTPRSTRDGATASRAASFSVPGCTLLSLVVLLLMAGW